MCGAGIGEVADDRSSTAEKNFDGESLHESKEKIEVRRVREQFVNP